MIIMCAIHFGFINRVAHTIIIYQIWSSIHSFHLCERDGGEECMFARQKKHFALIHFDLMALVWFGCSHAVQFNGLNTSPYNGIKTICIRIR